jgi:hypothetical protein
MSSPSPGPLPPSLANYYTLQAAIATGAKVVRFQDRTIEYQSTDEMLKAANYLYLLLAAQGAIPGVSGVNRSIRTYTNKGL